MRITGGTHRSRILQAPEGHDVRPTSDKVRLAVFNMLGARGFPGEDTLVLDGFCGTGALGLEALSRGAAHVVFMDKSRDSLTYCRRNIEALDLRARTTLIHTDVLAPPPRPENTPPAHLVFLDPPYAAHCVPQALAALAAHGWLAAGALCVCETARDDASLLPTGFVLEDDRRYGATRIVLCTYDPAMTPA